MLPFKKRKKYLDELKAFRMKPIYFFLSAQKERKKTCNVEGERGERE